MWDERPWTGFIRPGKKKNWGGGALVNLAMQLRFARSEILTAMLMKIHVLHHFEWQIDADIVKDRDTIVSCHPRCQTYNILP